MPKVKKLKDVAPVWGLETLKGYCRVFARIGVMNYWKCVKMVKRAYAEYLEERGLRKFGKEG